MRTGRDVAIPSKYEPLLASARVLWQTGMFMLVPALVAMAIVVPLAFVTKSLPVDLELAAHSVAFTLTSPPDDPGPIEFLRSVSAKAVTLSTDSIDIFARQVVDAGSSSKLAAHFVRLRPRDRGWVKLMKGEHEPLLLSQLELTSGSHVQLSQAGQQLTLQLTPAERLRVEISAADRVVVVVVHDTEILDANNTSIVPADDSTQHILRVTLSQPIVLSTTHPTELRAELASPDAASVGAWGNSFQVNHLSFPAGNREAAEAVRRADIAVIGAKVQPATDRVHYVTLAHDDVLEVAKIGSCSGVLCLTASGRLHSLLAGQTPRSQVQLLPSVLDWVYNNQQVGLLAGILIWVSGVVLAAVKLFADLTKLPGKAS